MTRTIRSAAPGSDYATGTLLVIISAITFSTAGLFTKGVEAGAWDVIFWRGLAAACFTSSWIALRGAARREFGAMGPSGWAVGVIGALGTAAFIPSFKLTSIANVSLIYAISPLIAAMLAWIFIGERAQARTIAGCLGALSGVAIIVSGSLGEISLYGDLLALWMTFAMASIMVIYRKVPETPGAGPQVLQSLLLLPVAGLIGAPLAVAPDEIVILIAFGLLFAIASVTLAEGAKRIASGQTALLSSLETPLAPILAFFVFAELPDGATWAGGALVLVAILASINARQA